MKYFVFIFLFCTGFFSSLAQSQHLVGVETSLQSTNMSSSKDYNSYQYKTGIGGGLTYTYQLPTLLSFSTGILYNPHGFSYKLIQTDEMGERIGEQNYVYGLDYISVPLKASFRFGAEKIYGFFSAGILASLLVNSFNSYQITQVQFEQNAFDLGILAELGASYEINQKFQLSANLNWQQNLLGIKTNLHPYERIFSNGLGVTLALKYRLG